MNWMDQINVLIFDMDGTLYQDYSFMGRYISKMMEGSFTEAEIEEIISQAYDLLEGRHPIKLGFMYDADELVFYKQEHLKPIASYDWEGTTSGLPDTQKPLAYIGDPWGIAHLMAVKKGIPAEAVKQAFDDVRTEMLMETYQIIQETDLFDEIRKLDNKRTILMTNSPLPTAQEFVDFLEISDVFDEFYFDGKKPSGIRELLDKLDTDGYMPREILSVGDHPWNDLYPVHEAGGHTCLISAYAHDDATDWTVTVRTMDELTGLIRKFNEASFATAGKEQGNG